MAILRIFFAFSMPGLSIGTITSDLLRCTGPSPVLTSMHIQSACRLLVIHIRRSSWNCCIW